MQERRIGEERTSVSIPGALGKIGCKCKQKTNKVGVCTSSQEWMTLCSQIASPMSLTSRVQACRSKLAVLQVWLHCILRAKPCNVATVPVQLLELQISCFHQ